MCLNNSSKNKAEKIIALIWQNKRQKNTSRFSITHLDRLSDINRDPGDLQEKQTLAPRCTCISQNDWKWSQL